jgi:hypothetical protein
MVEGKDRRHFSKEFKRDTVREYSSACIEGSFAGRGECKILPSMYY